MSSKMTHNDTVLMLRCNQAGNALWMSKEWMNGFMLGGLILYFENLFYINLFEKRLQRRWDYSQCHICHVDPSIRRIPRNSEFDISQLIGNDFHRSPVERVHFGLVKGQRWASDMSIFASRLQWLAVHKFRYLSKASIKRKAHALIGYQEKWLSIGSWLGWF